MIHRADLDRYKATVDAAYAELFGKLADRPSDDVIVVTAGQDLASVIAAQPDRAVFELEPGGYRLPEITKPVTIRSRAILPKERRAGAGPVLLVGAGPEAVLSLAPDVTLDGIDIRSENPDGGLLTIRGPRFTGHRLYLAGDLINGQHRGIELAGEDTILTRFAVVDCFSYGRDAQAIAGWNGCKRVTMDDFYAEGGAETVLFGGADSTSEANIPRDITMSNFTLSKAASWRTRPGVTIKNAFELKSAIGVTVRNGLMEYAGDDGGQGGYAMVLTVRNQDGTAPWSTVRDVTIEDITVRYTSGVVQFLGQDDQPGVASQVMQRVAIRRVTAACDPTQFHGHARAISIQGGPEDLTLEDWTVTGPGFGTSIYAYGPPEYGPAAVRLVMRRLQLPQSAYGMMVAGGSAGIPALQALMPDAIFEEVREAA